MPKTYLDTKQAAQYLGLKSGTLEIWRWRGTGPRFFKIGALVRYRVSDIDDWLESRSAHSTSQQLA